MTSGRPAALAAQREVSLVEILDRALGCGVVISGDLTISLADVDLVALVEARGADHVRVKVGAVLTQSPFQHLSPSAPCLRLRLPRLPGVRVQFP